jgi:predicted transcriptional regulator
MTFNELIEKLSQLGLTKGNLEKRCGFCNGKLTELAEGRMMINAETLGKIANALEELSEEFSVLAEETRTLDSEV